MQNHSDTATSWVGALLLSLALAPAARSQVLPDTTLPNNSIVAPNGSVFQIDGGTTAGNNLFHSFQEFSVPTGSVVFFNNATTINNILTRVTGGNLSNIDGLIRANGSANLFLINPNGIIFGPNAQLNIGGSFFGSTAESLVFDNGNQFSTTDKKSHPLLTINTPIGLQMGRQPAAIAINGKGMGVTPDNSSSALPLLVNPGQTLAIVGGEVTLEGRILAAPGGRIEIGGVGSNGFASIAIAAAGYALNYSETGEFADVTLSQQSVLSSSGEGDLANGAIQLRGDRLHLTEGSGIVAINSAPRDGGDIEIAARQVTLDRGGFIFTQTGGAGMGSNINLHASESVELTGSGYDLLLQSVTGFFEGEMFEQRNNGSSLFTSTAGSGTAGAIVMETGSLLMREGSLVSSTTTNSGASGSISLQASQSIDARSSIVSTVTALGSTGAGNNLAIATDRLTVVDGTQVTASTFGTGTAGNIFIEASDIELSDTRATIPPLGLITLTSINSPTFGPNAAGNITIHTDTLQVRNGASISTTSFPTVTPDAGPGGNIEIVASERVEVEGINNSRFSLIDTSTGSSSLAGDLSISTQQLIVRNGGQISSNTFGGSGDGGNVIISASERIEVGNPADVVGSQISATSGSFGLPGLVDETPTENASTGDAGSLLLSSPVILFRKGGVRVQTLSESGGNAGTLSLVADSLKLEENGLISASNIASGGEGGNVNITVDENLQLTRSQITSTTASGNGGNINLNVGDSLLLWNNSLISTTAGQAGAGGNGGNINISADLIVTFPTENSDIRANAFTGRGGNINITTESIFGLEFRPQVTFLSDITASSQFGVAGTVSVFTPDVDPSSGLIELSTEAIDPSEQIATGCAAFEGNYFAITGRGGLAEDPTATIRGSTVWQDWQDYSTPTVSSSLQQQSSVRSVMGEVRNAQTNAPRKLVEATGWIVHSDGTVELVATVGNYRGRELGINCAAEQFISPSTTP